MTRDGPLVSSTTLIGGTRFRPHGRVDMWMENDVLHYEATGPFNAEVFDCLAVAQKDFLVTLPLKGPWASICTLRTSAMATPDSIARYTQLMQSPKPAQFEPVATAFVIGPEIEGGKIMSPHFERIYTLIGRPFKVCATMDEAQTWVHGLIQASRATRD